MQAHTEVPALEGLDKLVHEQRRKVAGQLRISGEERALREQIDRLLEAAGVDVVSCEIGLGTFEVRRARRHDGSRYASVTPMPK